ncbi:alanine racemase [Arcobacter sp. FWKO B]|uniref:alanine racemase n=1 Tax=Arcobacter sp. FWKO B TaxID=2593672 RepID=UPI0018A38F25|nr:alanine racemase [Arcobacter sp. FWKO B]QOG11371.1 alanine racemase [Arcobacter sp. FWKO B]
MAKIILKKANYFHNLNTINKKLQNIDKIAVVLKDNAYGHGIINIAQMANEFGIKRAVVRTVKEAEQIKEYFDFILVLSDILTPTYSHTFHITINTIDDIEKICENTNVHLKVDTGMHRNGINQSMLQEAIYRISEQKLNLTGVFTHHRSSDILSSEFYWQRDNFYRVKKEVRYICEKLFPHFNPEFHSLNSSAVFRCENNIDDDFVRVGIAGYGYCDNQFPLVVPDLKPVASLVCNKVSSIHLKKGQRVGYAGEFTAPKDMVCSTYDIGYGDGFFRINGEKTPYITPKGYKLIGKVSMDSLSLDSCDDEVVLFDDVNYLAKLNDTITYEILTALFPHLTRVVV